MKKKKMISIGKVFFNVPVGIVSKILSSFGIVIPPYNHIINKLNI